MHCNGLKLSSDLEEFSITSRFWIQKCKKSTFGRKKCLHADFYGIQVQAIANLPSRLEKHQTLDILLVTDLIIFRIFQNFRKSSAAHTKIFVCVLFYVNILDKTSCNLMSPFSNDIFD